MDLTQLSDADLANLYQQAKSAQVPQGPNPAMEGGNLNLGPFDTGIRLSPGIDQALSGIGSGLSDIGLGIKERLGLATPQQVDAKRAADAPLKATTPGMIGNITGQALPAFATLPFPGANTLAGAAVTGGLLGSALPTGTTGPTVLGNALSGAAGGFLGAGAAKVGGRLLAPIQSALSPEQQRLAGVLTDNGVNLDLAQTTGSKPLQFINSALENLPITSGIEASKRAAQQAAFNRAVLAQGGVVADTATPDVIKQGLESAGSTIGNIAKRNSVNIDGQLLNDLFNTYGQYEKVLEPNQRAIIGNNLNAILNERGILSGETYQATRNTLGKLMQSTDPNLVQAAKGIRQALDDAAMRSINPEDASALTAARQNYAVMKTVGKAAQGPGAVSGNISPASLRQAVANSNPTSYVKGQGPLNDLARAGYTFLRDPNPNSATAPRLFYQQMLTHGLLPAATGGGAYAATGDPYKGLEGAAAGLLGPVAVQRMLASPIVGGYLFAGPGRALLAQQATRVLGPLLGGTGAITYGLARPQ